MALRNPLPYVRTRTCYKPTRDLTINLRRQELTPRTAAYRVLSMTGVDHPLGHPKALVVRTLSQSGPNGVYHTDWPTPRALEMHEAWSRSHAWVGIKRLSFWERVLLYLDLYAGGSQ